MIRIVVDANIVFGSLLNLNSNTGQILIRGFEQYQFFAPFFLN